ncbi:hypothetical protein KP509_13G071100 [Ceratopteris richardii]|uniref:Uncharacterized protein n=1 Tax=Ceratopteris richardii TaxID=49495 RepID=A0A8T2TIW7_CERRI|nr:hypothetical protein KP509_13G071100 [Ceratopteris richardii]
MEQKHAERRNLSLSFPTGKSTSLAICHTKRGYGVHSRCPECCHGRYNLRNSASQKTE